MYGNAEEITFSSRTPTFGPELEKKPKNPKSTDFGPAKPHHCIAPPYKHVCIPPLQWCDLEAEILRKYKKFQKHGF